MCGILKCEYLENPDIGFAFLLEYTRKGYAYEITRAMVTYARDILGIPRLMAITMPTNNTSIRLLEKVALKFSKSILLPAGTEVLKLFVN